MPAFVFPCNAAVAAVAKAVLKSVRKPPRATDHFGPGIGWENCAVKTNAIAAMGAVTGVTVAKTRATHSRS